MEAALNTVAGRLPLTNSIVKIGSSPDNHLVLQDPKASPLHAGIRPEELGYSLTDLGSASGTFVNGQRLAFNSPRLLYPGDSIRIGDTVFTYEITGTSQTGAVTPGNRDQGSSVGVSPVVAAPKPAHFSGDTGTQQAYQAVPAGSTANSAYPAPPAIPPGPTGGLAYPASPVHSTSYPPYVAPSIDAVPGHLQGAGQPQGSHQELTPGSLLQKEHRRDLWMALGILGAVLVIGYIVFANLHSPERTLDTFCNALRSGDYQTAYNQLSPGLQYDYSSESNFVNDWSRYRSCSYTSTTTSPNDALTALTATGASGSTTYSVELVHDSSYNWKIDAIKS